MLDEGFLSRYRTKGDPFSNLLSRSTYLGKFSRDGETWTDTVRRCVVSNVALDPYGTPDEARALFDVIWHMKGLPPGRGLWTGGVPNIPIDARYSCHYGTLRESEDWCWVANMLMCGGGVGVGLHHVGCMPIPSPSPARMSLLCSRSHPNEPEVMPDENSVPGVHLLVEDSREGWVDALRSVLRCAFGGHSLTINVSSVRKRGAPIRGFGGIASGPGPLAMLLRQVWAIVRGAAGRKLTSLECLDITNHIGVCIKSGNVRRSALIALGDASDRDFRDAKKHEGAILAHRHSSNNSVIQETERQVEDFDWRGLVEDASEFGEPGVLNLWRCRVDDPGIEGVNPCGEIPLYDREACCLSEVYPALFAEWDTVMVLRLMTRYTIRQRLEPMTDPRAEAVRVRNMRIGVGLGGICDFDWSESSLAFMHNVVRRSADEYAKELGIARPIACTTVKPSGTISLLNGSSPGIHAPFAPYYIRRVRISKDEAMAAALIEAGVPHEECAYDSTGHTLVFEFPMRSRGENRVTVQDERVREQVERQVQVQRRWADNSVSSTISFAEDEKDELAKCLQHYAKDLKSISCLPKKHGYQQPPYQAIERSEYLDRCQVIDHSHPLTRGGELQTEECEGGVCPIR
jgi:hypothetical protein